MKMYLKLSLILMSFGIALSILEAKGYVTPPSTSYSVTLKGSNNNYKTDYRTKNTTVEQKYYNAGSVTNLTPDCTNCKIGVQLCDKNGGISTIITQKGDLKKFKYSEQYGDYYLNIYRADFTLINTQHIGTWYINVNN